MQASEDPNNPGNLTAEQQQALCRAMEQVGKQQQVRVQQLQAYSGRLAELLREDLARPLEVGWNHAVREVAKNLGALAGLNIYQPTDPPDVFIIETGLWAESLTQYVVLTRSKLDELVTLHENSGWLRLTVSDYRRIEKQFGWRHACDIIWRGPEFGSWGRVYRLQLLG